MLFFFLPREVDEWRFRRHALLWASNRSTRSPQTPTVLRSPTIVPFVFWVANHAPRHSWLCSGASGVLLKLFFSMNE